LKEIISTDTYIPGYLTTSSFGRAWRQLIHEHCVMSDACQEVIQGWSNYSHLRFTFRCDCDRVTNFINNNL